MQKSGWFCLLHLQQLAKIFCNALVRVRHIDYVSLAHARLLGTAFYVRYCPNFLKKVRTLKFCFFFSRIFYSIYFELLGVKLLNDLINCGFLTKTVELITELEIIWNKQIQVLLVACESTYLRTWVSFFYESTFYKCNTIKRQILFYQIKLHLFF